MLFRSVIFSPFDNVIANKLLVSVTRVCPPSKVKYGAVPWITFVVWADNAWLLNENDRNRIDRKVNKNGENKNDLNSDLKFCW